MAHPQHDISASGRESGRWCRDAGHVQIKSTEGDLRACLLDDLCKLPLNCPYVMAANMASQAAEHCPRLGSRQLDLMLELQIVANGQAAIDRYGGATDDQSGREPLMPYLTKLHLQIHHVSDSQRVQISIETAACKLFMGEIGDLAGHEGACLFVFAQSCAQPAGKCPQLEAAIAMVNSLYMVLPGR